MRVQPYLLSMVVLTAGCAASTYPLNPQLAAQVGLNDAKPSFTEPPEASGKFVQQGTCSWYGPGFHGRRTSNGEVFDQRSLTAAHPSLPFGSRVEVTDVNSGNKVRVRINDRGPFIHRRILDLSYAAAASLGIVGRGIAHVELRLVDIDEADFPESAWALEVASFPSKVDATRFIDGMNDRQRSAGLYYMKSPDRQTKDYRVRFGPFDCEDRAKSAADQLRRVGLNPELTREGLTR